MAGHATKSAVGRHPPVDRFALMRSQQSVADAQATLRLAGELLSRWPMHHARSRKVQIVGQARETKPSTHQWRRQDSYWRREVRYAQSSSFDRRSHTGEACLGANAGLRSS